MLKLISLTAIAIIAFASNSILCRLALGGEVIDAASFTVIRLFSGAVFLLFLLVIKDKGKVNWAGGSWAGGIYLAAYAITFSFAYISLDTGVGALILFGAVQLTMLLISVFKGNRLDKLEWLGVLVAFAGLVWLLLPGATSPSPFGFTLMLLSGVCWGLYTLKGKGSKSPLGDTSSNFIRSVPIVFIPFVALSSFTQLSVEGVLLAVLSGTLASGLGYAIWYSVLRELTVTLAAVLQLLVPIVAAFGGVIFSAEMITTQLMISAVMVLGGILLVIGSQQRTA